MKNIIKKVFMSICLVAMMFTIQPAVSFAHWLPESEMSIGGIGYGCTMGYVKSIYGEPVEKKWFNNDGFRGVRYIYSASFSVTGRVADNDPMPEDELPVKNIYSAASNLSTPNGITCGIPVATLTGMYGKGDVKNISGRMFYYYLLPDTNRSMTFYVNNYGLISEMIYAEEW